MKQSTYKLFSKHRNIMRGILWWYKAWDCSFSFKAKQINGF